MDKITSAEMASSTGGAKFTPKQKHAITTSSYFTDFSRTHAQTQILQSSFSRPDAVNLFS